MNSQIILTGIKPTGTPHIGNYIGALKDIVKYSQTNETYVFIADLHAVNALRDAQAVKRYGYEIAAILLALGLDLNNAVLFKQSDIVQVSQLANLLMNVTPKGLMDRAHSYKACVEKNLASGTDVDFGVNMGLYTYPILMTADILLYDTDIVPVGADQKQHVEFARDIAGHFNSIYGDVFKLPDPVISEKGGIVPGLDGRKMSKSYDNTIPLFSEENDLYKKIMKIITDSKTPDEPKDPDTSSIFQLYKHFANETEINELKNKFLMGGMGYGVAKKILFEKINFVLGEKRKVYNDLMANKPYLDSVLAKGAIRATQKAEIIYNKVKKLVLG